MEQFGIISIFTIYFIGIPVIYAIFEDPENKDIFEQASIIAVTWPMLIIYYIFILLAYPFYWITKKIKNKLKH